MVLSVVTVPQRSKHVAKGTVLPGFLVQRVADSGWFRLAENVRAPREFHLTAEDPDSFVRLEVRLNDYGKPECKTLTLRRKDETAINWDLLRHTPLDDWLTHGLTLAIEVRHGGAWLPPGSFPTSPERTAILEQLRRSFGDRAGGRRPLTTEFLAAIADSYRTAVAEGRQPIKTLEKEFGAERRSTINKWVARARKAGLLEPAKYNRRKRDKKGGSDGSTANRSSRRKAR